MSAPSHAKFFVGEDVVFSHFINIGWFSDDTKLLELLIESLTAYHEAKQFQDFDFVRLYSLDFSIQDLIAWKKSEIGNDELLFAATERFKHSTVKCTR